MCHSHPEWRYRDSNDGRRIFVSTCRNYKVYANIDPSFTCTRRLVAIPDTGAGPNFVRESELPDRFETQLSTGLLPNICNAYRNPLQMLGIVKPHVLLGNTQETFNFIVCKTLAASAITGAEFCDQ